MLIPTRPDPEQEEEGWGEGGIKRDGERRFMRKLYTYSFIRRREAGGSAGI